MVARTRDAKKVINLRSKQTRQVKKAGSSHRRKGRKRLAFLIIVLLLALGLWGGWRYAAERYSLTSAGPSLVVAEMGSIEESVRAAGTLVRTEGVVVSPVSGVLRRLAGEGKSVRFDAPVAEVRDPAAQPSADEQAEQQKRLEEFDRLNGRRLADLKGQVEKVTSEIKEISDAIKEAIRKSQPEKANELKSRADRLAASEREIRQEVDRLEGLRQALLKGRDPKNILEGRVLNAPSAGILSFRVDGWEELITPEGLEGITPQSLAQLPERLLPLEDGANIIAGLPVFKVIDSLKVYLAVPVSAADAVRIQQARRVSIRTDGSGETEAVFWWRQTNPGGEQAVVILSTDTFPLEFHRIRRADFEIVLRRFEGVVVPRAALVELDGRTGVYLSGSRSKFWPVQVKGGSESRVVVEGLNPGALILGNPLGGD